MLMAKPLKNEIEELAARMNAADEQAFQEFSDTYGPRLRAFFASRGLRIADAEDLAVSCVSDISLRVNKYQPQQEGFEAWVFTLARNFLSDWRRKHPEMEPLPESLAAPADPEEPDEGNQPVIIAVRRAVAGLSVTDQMIVRLRYFGEERSFTEIGALLGIQPGAARVRHFRALKNLEGALKQDDRIQHFLNRKI